MKYSLAVCVVAMTISGCSYLPEHPLFLDLWDDESALEYYQRVSSAPEEARQNELGILGERAEPGSSVVFRVRLAMLVSVTESASEQDEIRALALLAGIEHTEAGSSYEEEYLQLGLIFQDLLSQNIELRAVSSESANLRSRLDELVSENGRLESQIEALKFIETQQTEPQ